MPGGGKFNPEFSTGARAERPEKDDSPACEIPRGNPMKRYTTAAIAMLLLALGGCTADGSADPDFHQALGESLDAANQIMQVVLQAVQTFGGQ